MFTPGSETASPTPPDQFTVRFARTTPLPALRFDSLTLAEAMRSRLQMPGPLALPPAALGGGMVILKR